MLLYLQNISWDMEYTFSPYPALYVGRVVGVEFFLEFVANIFIAKLVPVNLIIHLYCSSCT